MEHKLSNLGVNLTNTKLSNGVNLFYFERIGMPIAIRVVFFAGSRFDSILGTAHFLEHMMVAGTEKFPSKDLLAIPLEKIGGGFSASVDTDFIRFNVTIPQKEDLEIGLKTLEEMLWHSLFDEKTIENERGSIISEIKEDEADPYYKIDSLYYHMVFKNTVLENEIIGAKETVNKITKKDLLDFKNKYLTAGRMCIIVSGDVGRENLYLFDKYLSKYKPEKYFELPISAKISNDKHIAFAPNDQNSQTYIRFGFRTNSTINDDRESICLSMISSILGKGRASRLLKELRYKKGLLYGISAKNYQISDVGHFYISTSVEKEKANEVIGIIVDEIKKLNQSGITIDEFEFIKSAIIKSVPNIFETSWSWINLHEDTLIFEPESLKTVDYYTKIVNSITLDEVNLVVKKYLNKENMYLAVYGVDTEPKI